MDIFIKYISSFFDNYNIINDAENLIVYIDDNFSFSLFFEENILTINKIKKGRYNGTDIIKKIEKICYNVNIRTIKLEDQSTIKFGEILIDFAILYKLKNGLSWYEKLGYLSY